MTKPTTLTIIFCLAAFALKSQTSLDQLIQAELVAFPDCEIAIGIIDGEQELRLGYEVKDHNLTPVDNNRTFFEIASISKVFTMALVAKEMADGILSIEDPIQEHLSFPIKKDSLGLQTIQIKHLLTHTSGLKKNPLMSYNRYSAYLKRFELDYRPGLDWDYNNLAVGLLAEITAEKHETSWSQLIREQLLKPLGMNSTFIHTDEAPETDRVQCVNKKGQTKPCYFHQMGEFQWPSGGMISNVDDMMTWLRANMQIINPQFDYLHLAHDPLGDSISIPWFTAYQATQGSIWWHYRSEKNARILCHGGNSPAQTAFLAMDKEGKRGIILLTNQDGRSLMNDDQIMKTTALAMKVLAQ